MFFDLYNSNKTKIGRIILDEETANKDEIGQIRSFVQSLSKTSRRVDNLTGLMVRDDLMQRLVRLDERAMLLLVSLNFFSHINDYYGRDVADEILVQKAEEYIKMVNDDDVYLYRLNVSEFAILICDSALFEKYFLLMEHYILFNNECFIKSLNNEKIIVSQTIGVAYGQDRLLSMADVALKQAMTDNTKYAIYDERDFDNAKKQGSLENIKVYKNALELGNIIPYLQPIVRASDAKIVKYEALARLLDDKGRVISPNVFLMAAENDKTYEYFTRQILQKIFIIYSQNEGIELTINLTYDNIATPNLVKYITNRLDLHGGSGITFEIIESEDIKDYQILEEFILLAKKYGCKIAIDDFGSGYSNFTNIIKINTDFIKLDGSLIKDITNNKNVEVMVRSLIAFAKETGIQTVAEFVSDEAIAQKAREMGIDYLQGFLYGKPESPEYYGFVS